MTIFTVFSNGCVVNRKNRGVDYQVVHRVGPVIHAPGVDDFFAVVHKNKSLKEANRAILFAYYPRFVFSFSRQA